MLLSIVVPVYNCEKTIERTLNSIVFQLCEKSELIVVDDGSTDNSLSLIEETVKGSNYVKVIKKENGGLISARKAGIDAAEGDFIFNVDGGDEIADDTISTLLNVIEKQCDNIDYFVIDNNVKKDGETIERKYDGNYISDSKYLLLGRCPYSICFKIVRRTLYSKINVFDNHNISNGEDLCFSFELMNLTNRAYKIDKSLYIYNIENDSMSSDDSRNILMLNAIDYIKDYIDKNDIKLKEEFDYFIFQKTIMQIVFGNDKKNYQELYKYYLDNFKSEHNKYIRYKNVCLLLAKMKMVF